MFDPKQLQQVQVNIICMVKHGSGSTMEWECFLATGTAKMVNHGGQIRGIMLEAKKVYGLKTM